jgi:hypothetical protein
MTFSIKILRSTSKQFNLIKRVISIQLNGNIATISKIYEPAKRVPDAFRYRLTLCQGQQTMKASSCGSLGNFSDRLACESKNKKIVLVIESPHRDEYDVKFNPISPAQGVTGDNIDNQITSIIDRHNHLGLPNGLYDLIICNPVQFQASLFSLHKTPLHSKEFDVTSIRNKAWRSIYNLDKDTFYQRLSNYAPVVIINACTSNLRSRVTSEIKRWCKRGTPSELKLYISDTHPTQWTAKTALIPLTL